MRCARRSSVDCWLAITENRIGPLAYKPQDVVRAHNGTTIQVIHTDAEGRMVLADTLCLAARAKPRAIIDYATLTGACIYALTERYSGAFTNRPEARELIESAGVSSGERVWCFPDGQGFRHGYRERRRRCLQCSRRLQGRSHPGGALLEPLRARRRSPGCTSISRPARVTAASRTSRRRSPDSACATRSICCAADGRRRHGVRAMDRPDAFAGPTTGTCTCATAPRSPPS